MIGMFPPAADGTVRASSTDRMSQLVDEARQQSLEEIRPGDDGRMFYQLPIWKAGDQFWPRVQGPGLVFGMQGLCFQRDCRISLLSECFCPQPFWCTVNE